MSFNQTKDPTDFIIKVKRKNKLFTETLCSDHQTMHMTESYDSNQKLLTYKVPKYANGAYLLQVFIRIVCHPEFNQENAKRVYDHEKKKMVFRKSGEYLRVKVKFHNDLEITLHCRSSKRQPGNAWIHLYGGYTTVHANTKLEVFAQYFKGFLTDTMDIPNKKELRKNKHWKLSVLMLYEIARRVRANDVYQHIAIAAGIQMTMAVPSEITTQRFFDLFMGTERVRNRAFREIATSFYKHQFSILSYGHNSPTTIDMKIMDNLEKLMKMYKDPQLQEQTGLPGVMESLYLF